MSPPHAATYRPTTWTDDMYETDENAPHNGIYLFVRHQYESRCQPDQDEKEVALDEGDAFPGCPVCDEPGYWRYLRAPDKDPDR